MKLSEHEKELLFQALDLVTIDFEDNEDSYFNGKNGENEYFKKMLNPKISNSEYVKLQSELDNIPTYYEEFVELVNKLSE